MSIELDLKRTADALEAIALHLGQLLHKDYDGSRHMPEERREGVVHDAGPEAPSDDAPQQQRKKRSKKKASKKKAARVSTSEEPSLPSVTIEDVRDALVPLERDEVKRILAECGASRLSELEQDQFETAIALAKQANGDDDPLA